MEPAKTAEELVRTYFARMGGGDARGALDLLSDDATYEVVGSTPISGVATGRRAIVDTFFRPFTAALEGGKIAMVLDEVIAQGDRAAAVAHSSARGLTGLPYDNRYVFVFRTEAGRITSVVEYMDTALLETAVFGKTLA